MAIDDNFEIDVDDGVHALIGHPDHDAPGPLDSDSSGYRPTEDHDGGGSGHGGSHHGRDSDSHGSHRGKRSHDSDDADHSHKAKHTQKAKHSDDDSDRSDESARPKDRHGSRSHDSDDADHSHKAKRSHDSDDAEHSRRAKHPREDKHSDDSHEAKRSHDSDDAEHSRRAKHSHEDRHSDDSRDSGHSDETARPKDRHGSHSHGSKNSHDLGMSRQADGTVYDTANSTRAPLSSSGDVADDLIAAAYGTAPGNLGTAAAPRPSFPQVDTSELVKGAPREEPATGQTTSGDEQPYVVARDANGTPTHVRILQPVNTTTMVTMGGNNTGYVNPPVAPSSAPAGLPDGARVVATDAAGHPTHIVLDHPVEPPRTMVQMGGNNPFYVGTQSATGDPAADPTHVVSPVPIPEIYHGPDHDRTADYPTPGSAAAKVAAFQSGLRESNHDVQTGLITGATPIRDAAGNITGHSPTNGSEIYSNLNDARDQHDKRLAGDPNPYSGPTKN